MWRKELSVYIKGENMKKYIEVERVKQYIKNYAKESITDGKKELDIVDDIVQICKVFDFCTGAFFGTYRELEKEALYALKSNSLSLVHKAYGKACILRKLEIISKEEFYKLNEMLIKNGINNPTANLK